MKKFLMVVIMLLTLTLAANAKAFRFHDETVVNLNQVTYTDLEYFGDQLLIRVHFISNPDGTSIYCATKKEALQELKELSEAMNK